MRTTTRKLLALATAATLGLAACGGGDEEAAVAVSGAARPVQEQAAAPEAAPADAEAPEDEATVDDAASTLRADLTRLLQEHVHLTALATDAVADDGPDAPVAQAAIQALDDNAAALGEVIGGLPGVDDPDAFLEAWREHVGAYVDHAAGRAEEDDAAVEEAASTLEGLLEPMAGFFEEISDEELVADELYGELETHVAMVTEAIDAHVAGEAEAPDLWREAALHMDAVAADLSAGIVAAHPDELPGDPLSVPAETRATLVSGFVEHTYLTLFAAAEAADAGGDAQDPAVQAAVTALDGSADGLAGAVNGTGGNEGREAFLELWRPFLTAATDHAAASAAGDTAAADAARATLEGTSAPLAELLDQSTAGNAPSDLASALDTHVAGLLGAIEAIVAADPAAYGQARAAAEHAAAVATGLAGALVAAEPPSGEGDGTDGAAGAEGSAADAAAPGESSGDAATVSSSAGEG